LWPYMRIGTGWGICLRGRMGFGVCSHPSQQHCARSRVGHQANLACSVSLRVGLQPNIEVGLGQKPSGLVRPLSELQAGASKDVAKPGVFPLLRVA
jgi:hypothetical protein